MGKIASDVFESLFGNLRRGADIDHERHPTLFADLCDGKRAPGINVSDDALGAFVDDALSSDPGLVDIAFGVDMHEFDAMAIIRKHLRRDRRAAMGGLAGRRHVAGAWQ
jgi:hypothetical protein